VELSWQRKYGVWKLSLLKPVDKSPQKMASWRTYVLRSTRLTRGVNEHTTKLLRRFGSWNSS
jgi:hypothetical protein